VVSDPTTNPMGTYFDLSTDLSTDGTFPDENICSGAKRAALGHPAPFTLNYVEVNSNANLRIGTFLRCFGRSETKTSSPPRIGFSF
jgi:hypothetical protein